MIDVCIVSFDSAPVIGPLLDQLATRLPEASVSIREHGSDEAALAALHVLTDASPRPVAISVDRSNPGFGAGCNALAAESSAQWLLFLNPDARVLAWPWSVQHPPPSGNVIGPVMVGAGESARQSGVAYGILDEIKRSWLRRPGRPVTTAGFVSGAAMLIERDAFRRLGGFDERFFMYYEDIDLCRRANAAGIATRLEPGWRVEHGGAHSTAARFGESLRWSYESACRFHGTTPPAGPRLFGYRSYVVVDSVLRALHRTVTADPVGRRAYLALAGRAARDLFRRPHPDR